MQHPAKAKWLILTPLGVALLPGCLGEVEDLRYVPSTRLEGWGVPLKLLLD